MEILIAEDDEVIAASIRKHFLEEGHHAVIASDGDRALRLTQEIEFDIILLDWRMPKKTGFEVCKTLRESGLKTPIILLTALNEVNNKVDALNHGADDYITKPFVFDELLARVNAVSRRYSASISQLTFDHFTLNLFARTLTAGDIPVRLSNKEFDLLNYFLRHKNEIISKDRLAREVWELPEAPPTNIIEATVKNLRKKLDEYASVTYIKTIYGEGYVFASE